MATTFARILGPDGRPVAPRPVRSMIPVRAKYDAAQTTEDSYRHWANADSLSARSANSPAIRRKLRDRARYESANNSYARGIVLTLANDTIGTGPRLQLLTSDSEANRRIEQAFMVWSAEMGLAEKLRTMRQARAVDGESFAILTSNPRLATDVQLDLKLVEAEQVATPDFWQFATVLAVDGIRFDEAGNPIEYHVLKVHPGDAISYGSFAEYDRVPARLVLHWFRSDRPGQARGIPDITPALPLFAQLRRFTLAVLAAAETAADFAAILYSEMPPDGTADPAEPFESLEIERRMMTTVPAGWKMGQFKAEQPTTTYKEFKNEILNEIARCLNMPFNVAAGNSSGYNYSSGRLDHQVYYKSLCVDQSQAELVILDRLLAAWIDEASLATDLIPDGPGRLEGWPHRWLWDGHEHVDPEKEANAQEIRLRNLMTTFSDECQKQGVDPESQAKKIAADRDLFERYGIPIPAAWNVPTPAPTGAANDGQSNQGQ